MQKLAHEIYSFDEFQLDITRGALFRGDEELRLRPKSFDVLKFLTENHGRLVAKDELIAAVWNETAVTDDSLVQCMKDIRHALGDDAQQIIKTVPRRGYIFEREVASHVFGSNFAEEAAGLHLVIENPSEKGLGHPKVAPRLGIAMRLLIPAALFLLLVGIGYGWVLLFRQLPGPRLRTVSVKPLTTDGRSAGDAAISPDGKFVVFAMDNHGQESLWVRQVAAVNPTQVAPPGKEGYDRLVFSPDSSFIYYQQANTLYRVPVLGGGARKVLENVNSAVTFSPDGARLAFVRRGQDEQKLILVNADGTGDEQLLAVRNLPEFFILPVLENAGLAWSPDGTTIVCPGGDGGGFGQAYPVAVSAADGSQKPVTEKRWNAIVRMSWLADGSGLLMNAKDNGLDATRQIWHVSYPNGEPQRIYTDDNEYDTLSLSADSYSLVSVRREIDSNIWVVESPDEPVEAEQITFGTRQDGYWGMDTTPDGRIVFDSRAGGVRDLWIMDADGGNQKQLTNDPLMEAFAKVSPNGRQIVFHLGGKGLWTMDIDGGNRRQLTDAGMFPTYSHDGKWILYTKPNDRWSMWRITSDGGVPERLTEHPVFHPSVSPDGEWIVYLTRSSKQEPILRIIPFDGGEPYKEFSVLNNRASSHAEWTPDGKYITYTSNDNGIAKIVNQPYDGGEPKIVVSLKTDRESIREFAWSRDGKRLFFASGPLNSNVVLFTLGR